MSKFTQAVEKAKIDIVPKTVISMGSSENGGSAANAFEMLLGLLVREKLGVKVGDVASREANDKIKEIKDSILKSMEEDAAKNELSADKLVKEQAAPAKVDK
jgi:ABC-type lipoprotein release transport system permease subunit